MANTSNIMHLWVLGSSFSIAFLNTRNNPYTENHYANLQRERELRYDKFWLILVHSGSLWFLIGHYVSLWSIPLFSIAGRKLIDKNLTLE